MNGDYRKEAGDPIVELRHLKQPAEEVGPLRILHDQARGELTVFEEADSLSILRKAPKGLTPTNLAAVLFGADPTPAQVEKARRKLKRHLLEGDAHVKEGEAIRGRIKASDTYVATENILEEVPS